MATPKKAVVKTPVRKQGSFTVEYDGETYTVDPQRLDDVEVLEAFMDPHPMMGNLRGAMKALMVSLGDDYEKFKLDQVEKHGVCTGSALGEMFNKVDAATAQGNSQS